MKEMDALKAPGAIGQRSLPLDVWCKNDAARNATVDAIRRYRAVAARTYALFAMSELAGAEIEEIDDDLRVTPNHPRAHELLQQATGKKGVAAAYPLRDWVLSQNPSWHSFVWDSLRRDVIMVWRAKDAEFPRASRGWLTLQGARSPAGFRRRAIGFPQATARPKLNERSITLNWDHEIGPVELTLAKLDAGRWAAWRRVRDREYEAGTLYLSECDGRLRVILTYALPTVVHESFLGLLDVCLPEAAQPFRLITDGYVTEMGVTAAAAKVAELAMRRARWERERGEAGNPCRKWGCRHLWKSAQKHLDAVTLQRSRVTTDWNHQWSRRIVEEALRLQCGHVRLSGAFALANGQSWPVCQLHEMLAYKAAQHGLTLTVGKEAPHGPPSDQ